MALHKIEINFPSQPGPDFFIKIDGFELKGVASAVIKSGMASRKEGGQHPTIEIVLIAESISGEVGGAAQIERIRI